MFKFISIWQINNTQEVSFFQIEYQYKIQNNKEKFEIRNQRIKTPSFLKKRKNRVISRKRRIDSELQQKRIAILSQTSSEMTINDTGDSNQDQIPQSTNNQRFLQDVDEDEWESVDFRVILKEFLKQKDMQDETQFDEIDFMLKCRLIVYPNCHKCKNKMELGVEILMDFKQDLICHELGISCKQVTKARKILLQAIETFYLDYYQNITLGEKKEVIEVDEASFRRKFNRGSILRRYQRIIGLAERGKQFQRTILLIIPKRDAYALIPIIENFISKRCKMIVSDSWRGYSSLQSRGFKHFKVNHSKEFVVNKMKRIKEARKVRKDRITNCISVNQFTLNQLKTNGSTQKINQNKQKEKDKIFFKKSNLVYFIYHIKMIYKKKV
ncbi:hypothetical protein ABPG72_018983 [Tetrahymena utriculariae]